MYPLPLEAFACLEVWLLGHDGLVLLSIVAQALICNFLCAGSSSSLLPVKPLMTVSGKSRPLCARFCTKARPRCRVAEGGLHLLGEVNVLDHRVKRFCKHVLSFEEPSASYPCNL
jgi:hypothetical protein